MASSLKRGQLGAYVVRHVQNTGVEAELGPSQRAFLNNLILGVNFRGSIGMSGGGFRVKHARENYAKRPA